MADVILRFKLAALGSEAGEPGGTTSLIGFAATISDTSLVPFIDITVPDGTPDGVAVVTEVFEDVLGWTLTATDPVTSIEDDARALMFAVNSLHETGGPTDLAIGIVADGEALARSGSALVGVPLVPSQLFLWTFSTMTAAADPGGGKMRMDDAIQADVENLYFDQVTAAGLDFDNLFSNLVVGEVICGQQVDDSSKRIIFQIAGTPTNNTGWWTVPVTFVSSAGALFTNNKAITWLIKIRF